MNDYNWIIDKLPFADPFLFVEEIESASEEGMTGYYTYSKELDFYKGHFRGNPITPGVIMSETMAQIGVVSLGIFLFKDKNLNDFKIGMSSMQTDFYIPVFPGERVKVISEKEYFRFNKLKCSCKMYNSENKMVAKSIISGMVQVKKNE